MTRAEQQARKAQQERMRQVERRHKEAARGQMDLPFLILTLLLTAIGLIMLFSASFPRAYYDLIFFYGRLIFRIRNIYNLIDDFSFGDLVFKSSFDHFIR